jgi:inosine-uridine nucleoside N-ribohydrolase
VNLSVALDIDPGIDDALAVALALHSPEIRLELVTTVAGNGPLEMTTRNALRVLHHLGADDIPVVAGAAKPLRKPFHGATGYHGHDALGGIDLPDSPHTAGPGAAIDALYQFATAQPGERVLVATGPLTNVAQAFQRHPGLPAILKEVVIMGGAFGLTRYGTAVAEFNIWQDPDAAEVVFASGASVSIVGLDVTNDPTTALTDDDLALLRAGSTPTTRMAADITAFALKTHPDCALHDPLALAVLLDRTLFDFAHGSLEVHTEADSEMGRTIVRADSPTSRPAAAVAATVDGPRFKQMFLSRILED